VAKGRTAHSKGGKMLKKLMITALLMVFSAPLLAEQIYKTVNPDGSISFSDTKPRRGDTEAIPMPKPANIQPMDERAKEQIKSYKTNRDASEQQREELQANVKEAEKELASARQALIEGAEVGSGDRQNTKNGSRLSQDYFDRVSKLESDVKKAEKNVKEAKKTLANPPKPEPVEN
jgi:chromosome segregation ATPase